VGDPFRPGGQGRRQKPENLVRPYVPDAESYDADTVARQDVPPLPARGRRPPRPLRPTGGAVPQQPDRTGHPYDDIDEFYADGGPARGEGTGPRRGITAPLPVIGLAMRGSSVREGSGRGGSGNGGWLAWIAGHRWTAALAAGISVLTVACAVILILPQHPSHGAAAGCTGACGNAPPGTSNGSPRPTPAVSKGAGSHPASSPSASASGKAGTQPARHPSSSPHPTGTRTSPAPKPTKTSSSPTPAPPPVAPPPVSVSYTLVHQWQNGFQGQFTIDNSGSKPITGWVLTAVLSGDQVKWAWPALFSMSGSTLTLTPPPSQNTIPPGTTLTENFMANGSTTSPSSCTFNGSPC
jgi:hypothetical protein